MFFILGSVFGSQAFCDVLKPQIFLMSFETLFVQYYVDQCSQLFQLDTLKLFGVL